MEDMKYRELIDQMTREEKASLLSGKNFWQTKPIERLGIPSIALADGPHGIRKQEGDSDHLGLHKGVPATCFPTGATVANSWDPRLGYEIGKALGAEARNHGVDVILGPGLNIKRSPLCGRNFEYISEDPFLSGKMATGYVLGVQEQGVAACPKHFVANNQEHLRMTNNSIVDARALHEIYLKGFEIVVKEGSPKCMMSSYNKINGTYANEHHQLLQETLVNQWGFQGVVVTDWGGSNDHVAGVAAGSHIEMPATGGDSDRQLVEAMEQGTIDESLVDQRVDELLQQIFTLKQEQGRVLPACDLEEHHRLAQRVAEQSTVLLKNEDSILPLAAGTRVAVIGDFAHTPRYQGAGSSLVNPTKLDNLLEAFETSSLTVLGYAQGFRRVGKVDTTLEKEACELARQADVVICNLGLEEIQETEGMDREHARISDNQIALLKNLYQFNNNIIVVLSCGGYVEMDWIDQTKALLHGYLGGQAGAKAMVEIITGQCSPSGKLSESYPYVYEDTPASNYYPGKERSSEYRESIYVGYRYYNTVGKRVRFPFGYGLSYTTFEYSNLQVTKDLVHCTITNTGSIGGAEIVQLYVAPTHRSYKGLFRPAKELKGFVKLFLEPGESRDIMITLGDAAFSWYCKDREGFKVVPGNYTIMLGASVEDIRLQDSLEISSSEDDVWSHQNSTMIPNYTKGTIEQISENEFQALLEQPLPPAERDRTKLLELNDPLQELVYAKSFLARRVGRLLRYLKNRSIKKGKPNLNILFMYNMPFRGIAKMMNGMVSMEMAETLVYMANGHPFRGFFRLIGGWFRLRKAKKATAQVLNSAGNKESS